MIISASRRTDIPAFYSDWLMRRVREGHCEVASPFRAGHASRVSLRPEDAEVIVFWTRDAGPLLPHLPELDARGYRYYFQYTLTGYPRLLEPGAPAEADAAVTLRRLAERIGAARVIWRYDPVIFTSITPPAYHLEQFSRLAEALRGATERAVISIADEYRWATARLRRLAGDGALPLEVPPESAAFEGLMRGLAAIAAGHGLEITSCAETIELRPHGILPGKCVDDALVRRLFGLEVTGAKDPSQRKACGCVVSKDIGAYDTCVHGCVYCYATKSLARARKRHAEHDAHAAGLAGRGDRGASLRSSLFQTVLCSWRGHSTVWKGASPQGEPRR